MYRFLLCSHKNAFQSQVIGHIKSCVRPKNDQTEDTHNWVWEHIFYVRNCFGHVQQRQQQKKWAHKMLSNMKTQNTMAKGNEEAKKDEIN